MTKAFAPKIATANDLLLGDVIYFTNPGWTREISHASVALTPEQAQELLHTASQFPAQTVGVYLADVTMVDGQPTPAHFREDFRANGPSHYAQTRQDTHI